SILDLLAYRRRTAQAMASVRHVVRFAERENAGDGAERSTDDAGTKADPRKPVDRSPRPSSRGIGFVVRFVWRRRTIERDVERLRPAFGQGDRALLFAPAVARDHGMLARVYPPHRGVGDDGRAHSVHRHLRRRFGTDTAYFDDEGGDARPKLLRELG